MMPEDVHEEKLSFLDFEKKMLQTDGPMDKWTNGPTDGPNDGWRDSYRDARMDKKKLSHITNVSFRDIQNISMPSLHVLCCKLFII